MALHRSSPCKVNLLLNILGRRPDGFHDLESVMLPVPIVDHLVFERAPSGIHLRCNHPELPVDATNLVHRAAGLFLQAASVRDGVRIHLEKHLPLAAGLGGGSSNAAITLEALNDLFDKPLPRNRLLELAAQLGSDVPFFLQRQPALATGRGERVESVEPFEILRGAGLLLVHPGFGISTPWAYRALADFPEALQGRAGRALEMMRALRGTDWDAIAPHLYNSLEAPVLYKYPILQLLQEFIRSEGTQTVLMSGSGSTTFALLRNPREASLLADRVRGHFGELGWITTTDLPG